MSTDWLVDRAEAYFARLSTEARHVRWITRTGWRRYRAIFDCGCYRWQLVSGVNLHVESTSSGGFYDDMLLAAPTWRRHHPSALVELVLAVRKHAAQRRVWNREFVAGRKHHARRK